jgi:hypothetical protein
MVDPFKKFGSALIRSGSIIPIYLRSHSKVNHLGCHFTMERGEVSFINLSCLNLPRNEPFGKENIYQLYFKNKSNLQIFAAN